VGRGQVSIYGKIFYPVYQQCVTGARGCCSPVFVFGVRAHRSENLELLSYSVIDLHCGLRSFSPLISLPTEREYFLN